MVSAISVSQAAANWRVSEQRVRQWLSEGRIKGARKVSRDWVIPGSAKRPEKMRKNGKP